MPTAANGSQGTGKKLDSETGPDHPDQPTEFLMGVIVSLGGCSACSFRCRPVATNHHCVYSVVVNSTKERDLLANGLPRPTQTPQPRRPAAAFVTLAVT